MVARGQRPPASRERPFTAVKKARAWWVGDGGGAGLEREERRRG